MYVEARNRQRDHSEGGKAVRFSLPGRLAVLLALIIPLSACEDDRFPRDSDGTFEAVLSSKRMTVAAVDHEPWVLVNGENAPRGAEVELIERFAQDLGVEITWKQMPAFEALAGLQHGDVDLAIGGFERSSVTPTPGAAPTYAYFLEALVIGSRPNTPVPTELDGHKVFVPAQEPLYGLVRNKDGSPVGEWSEDVALAALPHWQLETHDLMPTGIVLRRANHVMAVPQGENAWLMRLERFLRSETGDMGERLREHRP